MSEARAPLKVKGYTISDELFTRGYPEGSSPCSCVSACCEAGVWADLSERERILRHKEIVKRHMDQTQTTDDAEWFDPETEQDPDFASGRAVATRVFNGKCAFLDRSGRCSLQVTASAEGMDRWALKPLYCILYPIYIENGTVGFDDLLQDEHACCSIGERFSVPLFEACRDELTHLLGEDGFAVLQEHYRRLQEENHSTTPLREK